MTWFANCAVARRAAYLTLATLLAAPTLAAATEKPAITLITNVNIFDGKNEQLSNAQDVLIEGNLIKTIGTGLIADNDATVIDGGGRHSCRA